jgi:hypothetical protein
VRFGALLAAGALTLHQLRYLVADGDSAGSVMRADGHAYLSAALVPILVFVSALLLGSLLRTMERPALSPRRGFGRSVAAFAIGLVAIYFCQETLEGFLASGHASGLSAAIASGGWVAAPLALALAIPLAAVAAFLDRIEARLVEVFAEVRTLPRPPAEHDRPPRLDRGFAPAFHSLAFGFTRRPPPLPAH